jgi:hypothetical protein
VFPERQLIHVNLVWNNPIGCLLGAKLGFYFASFRMQYSLTCAEEAMLKIAIIAFAYRIRETMKSPM